MERCLIIEDHVLYADVMQVVVRCALPGVDVVLAPTLRDARAAIGENRRFKIILLDLCLPDGRGLLGLLELQRLCPNTPIVINTAFAERGLVEAAMICGASGFIPKTDRKDAVIAALRTVVAGGVTLPVSYRLDPEFDCLTGQQSRVLEFVAEGFLNKQIAHNLKICETTVKAHMGEILRKLKVANRTQAALKVAIALDRTDGIRAGSPAPAECVSAAIERPRGGLR